MYKKTIAAIILTHNEEQHIARCLRSISGIATDIVVVDSYSKDRTVEIAEGLGARVFRNPWINYAVQFQWALDNCQIRTDWIIRIDADEYAETNLIDGLSKTLSSLSENITGLYVKRKYKFLGQWIRHGAMYPIYVLRIWRNGAGRMEQRWMDEHVVLLHGEATTLDCDIVDDNLNSVAWWIDKHNRYATREMIDLLNNRYNFLPKDEHLKQQSGNVQAKRKRVMKERIYSRLPLFFRPLCYFFYRYFIRLGFLDGTKGLAFHFMQGLWYRALVDLKILEAEKWIKACSSKEEIKTVLAEKTGLEL